MTDDVFINPYTFVPLPQNGAARFDCSKPAGDPISGEIKCSLITVTQLSVPDELKNPCLDEEQRTEPREYDFFKVNGTAVIPGSGIRGVIRSVFETLTDSCMRLNDTDKDYFHTRVNKEFPGIIEYKDGNYILYKANRLRDMDDLGYSGKHKTGDLINGISSKPGKNSAPDIAVWKSGSINGVYLCADRFGSGEKVSHPSVLVKKEVLEKQLDKRCVDRLKINAEMYKGKYGDDYREAVKKLESGRQLPVWYYRDQTNGYYYFAPSQYSRAVFVNKPRDLAKAAKIRRCTELKSVCAACALFGFIDDDKTKEQHKGDCRASRVRFTDAVCQTPDPFDGSYILPILANPRLSSFEFYLNSENVEKIYNQDNKIIIGKEKFGADTEGVTLAGRKFYWHDLDRKITSNDVSAEMRPNMAVKMELVKSGAKFEFSVFFDNITEKQLKQLVYALTLGDNYEDSRYCHKIGHGKPVGLGSVKILVDSVTCREFKNGEYSVKTLCEDEWTADDNEIFDDPDAVDNLLTVLDTDFLPQGAKIDYPRQQPGGDIFEWFAKNRGALRSKGYIEVKQLLPKITDNTQTLKRIIPPNSGQGNNKKYRGT